MSRAVGIFSFLILLVGCIQPLPLHRFIFAYKRKPGHEVFFYMRDRGLRDAIKILQVEIPELEYTSLDNVYTIEGTTHSEIETRRVFDKVWSLNIAAVGSLESANYVP